MCTCYERLVCEPRHGKTCCRGFRRGVTQTGLYSHRIWLEDWTFRFRKLRECTIYVAKNKGADQLRGYHAADLRLCLRIYKTTGVHMKRLVLFDPNLLMRPGIPGIQDSNKHYFPDAFWQFPRMCHANSSRKTGISRRVMQQGATKQIIQYCKYSPKIMITFIKIMKFILRV